MAAYFQNQEAGFLLLIIIFSLFTSSMPTSIFEQPPTVFEILPKFGLPSGLLPNSVKSYALNNKDGNFEVELSKPCYIHFDYLVYYEQKIYGKLSMGSITNLKGIQVKRMLFWFDVDEIRVDFPPSDSIYFQVGIINKKLDVDQFQTVHSCQDKALASCGEALKQIFQESTPGDDVSMLITE